MKLQLVLPAFLCVLLAIPNPAAAQRRGGRLESMKLLTDKVGWTATTHQLFWTTDGGQSWKDITPEADDEDSVASVFFLDTSTGWVLLSRYDEPEPYFDVARTTDGGKNWSVAELSIPKFDTRGLTLNTQASLDFIDAAHGWMNISTVSSASAHGGALLKTEDGGKTWSWTKSTSAGTVRFATAMDGWVLSPEHDELYETHDGAKTWRETSLAAPKAAFPSVNPTYDAPTFKDGIHGFLPVTYSAPYSDPNAVSALILFSTDDAGKRWVAQQILPGLRETSIGEVVPSVVAGATWVVGVPLGATLRLTGLAVGGGTSFANSADVHATADVSALYGISFANDSSGWALASARTCAPAIVGCTQLLATSDAGRTWTNITPPEAKGVRREPLSKSEAGLSGPTLGPEPSAIWEASLAAGSPAHIGFDVSKVMQPGH